MSFEKQELQSGGRRFELKERIGAGAYGEVYLAEQYSGEGGFHRRVALKMLHDHNAGAEMKRRIRDEARILGHIQHRSVVAAYDLVRLGQRWGVVMDYVPGCDVQELLDAAVVDRCAIPVAAALEIGAEIARAMHAAWTATDEHGSPIRVIHRDIKPSNVRLTPDGDVKVLDFGIASVQMAGREARTGGQVLGTLAYMSPERQEGDHGSLAGDVYALGKLTAELLLGRPVGRAPADIGPHDTWLKDQLDAVLKQLDTQAATASLLLPLLERALAFDPARRPAAEELADQLGYLSRAAPGQPLRDFAKRFVPKVPAILDKQRVPAHGIVAADSATWSGETPPRSTILPPVLIEPPDLGTAPRASAAGPRPEPPASSPASQPPASAPPASVPQAAPTGPTTGDHQGSGIPPSVLALLGAGVLLAIAVGGVAIGLSLRGAEAPSTPSPRTNNVVVLEAPREPAPREPAPAAAPAPAPDTAPAAPRPTPAPVKAQPELSEPPPAEAAPVEPAPAGEAEAPEPEPTPAPEPAVAPEPAPPAPAPAPAPPPPPSLAGTWVGTATGRPLTLRLGSSAPGSVSGRAEFVQGPTIRSFDISGSVAPDGSFVLTDNQSGLELKGTLDSGTVSGSFKARSNGKWQPYSADLQ